MSELPPLPTSAGLTCQGWNWTLQQVNDYVASYGKCEIGAMYTTDDGKTRIKITIYDPKYSNIPIIFQQTVANGVEVDWGDGSATQTYSSTSQQAINHQYSPSSYPSSYVITFKVNSGTMSFPTYIMGKSLQNATYSRDAWLIMIDEVNIGNNVTSIGQYAFQYCKSLILITIPNSVTNIDSYAFQYSHNLKSIVIPSSFINIGQYIFRGCYSLASIIIPNSVTNIGSQAFSNCYSLASIIIPNSVTNIGSQAFYNCSFASIIIPNSVISINNSFGGCSSLASIIIPNSVTSINQLLFSGCYGLKTIDFRTHISVPSLENVNAFQNTLTTREIIVPDELYDTWKSATNWNSTTNNIVGSIVKASESSLGPLS